MQILLMLLKLPSYLRFLVVNQKTDNFLCSLTKPLREEYHTGCLREMIGPTEFVIIGIMAIFLFGAKRIPELARNLGRAKGEFHAGISDVTSPSRAELDMDRGGVTDEVANENE